MASKPQSSATRRTLLLIGGLAVALSIVAGIAISYDQSQPAPPTMVVYKHPECGCCTKWVGHLRESGFRVRVNDTRDWPETRQKLGVPDSLAACHTGVVNGYLVEGHVPAEDIHRLLRERPAAKGLAVPGMPIGSPGMEASDQREPYDVLLMTEDDRRTVYAHHE